MKVLCFLVLFLSKCLQTPLVSMFDLNWSNMLCVCGCNESEGGFSVKRLATNVGPEQIAPEKCGEKDIMRFLSSNVI